MAYYSLYPTRDSTIYEKNPRRNSGIDQILEISKIVPHTPDPDGHFWEAIFNSRILIEFNTAQLNVLRANGTIPSYATYYLNLRATEATDMPINYTLHAHPVASSWENGSGHYNDYPEITEGVSWKYRDGYYLETGTEWLSGSLGATTSSFYSSTPGGGVWHSGSNYEATQSFDYPLTPDIRINVTNIVQHWLSGSIANHGFIVKRSNADESSTIHLGGVKFFSKDTHTIYLPKLEAVWDDSDLSGTGSLAEITDNYTVHFKNIKEYYKATSKEKFRIIARDLYPTPTFATSSYFTTTKRLPITSYYAVQDSVTDDFIVPFDGNNTRLSVDSQGNYFKLDMQAFLPERFYRIILKIIQDGGAVERIVDDNIYFKVIR